MSSNIGPNEFYHVVVRRGAVVRNSHAVVRKPFVWEIRHKETTQLLGAAQSRTLTWKKLIGLVSWRSHA